MMTSKKHFSYSQNTMVLIEKYMTESKLTTLQKQAILDDLKKGRPIPATIVTPTLQHIIKSSPKFSKERTKKRKLETIIQNGAFDIPTFVSDGKIIDREKEKQKLQDIFYGLDQIPDEVIDECNANKCSLTIPKKFSKYDRMDELKKEIEDRIQFLDSMDKLGQKWRYEFEISNQIAEKLKQLEDLTKSIKE